MDENETKHKDWSDVSFEKTAGSCADSPIERAPQCGRCADGAKLKKLKRRNKKLQRKAWKHRQQRKYAERDAKFWQEIVQEQDEEIEKLKAPKVDITMVVGDGIVSDDDT